MQKTYNLGKDGVLKILHKAGVRVWRSGMDAGEIAEAARLYEAGFRSRRWVPSSVDDGTAFIAERVESGTGLLPFQPYAGYLHLVPRSVIDLAYFFFPFRDLATAITVLCCLLADFVTSTVYICSASVLRSRGIRSAVALLPVMVPVAPLLLVWLFLAVAVCIQVVTTLQTPRAPPPGTQLVAADYAFGYFLKVLLPLWNASKNGVGPLMETLGWWSVLVVATPLALGITIGVMRLVRLGGTRNIQPLRIILVVALATGSVVPYIAALRLN